MKKEFAFDYSKYKKKKINIKMLDDLRETTIASGTSKFAKIMAMVKIIIFFAYLWGRKRLIDEEFTLQRQAYEQRRINENGEVLAGDDLDGAVNEDNLD